MSILMCVEDSAQIFMSVYTYASGILRNFDTSKSILSLDITVDPSLPAELDLDIDSSWTGWIQACENVLGRRAIVRVKDSKAYFIEAA